MQELESNLFVGHRIEELILSCVFVARLNFVQEKEGLEEQTGFRGKA